MEHEISVAKFKELLARLHDEDVLIPNTVGNLSIFSGDQQMGYVDLLKDNQDLILYAPSA